MDIDDRQAAAKERAKAASKRADDVLAAVMATADGREFVEHVIYRLSSLKSLGFNSDPSMRDFLQGQRAVGQALERQAMRVDRDLWAQMEFERTNRLKTEVHIKPASDDDDSD